MFESKEISSQVLIPAWKNWAIGEIHMRNFSIEVSGADIAPLDGRDGSLWWRAHIGGTYRLAAQALAAGMTG